MELIVRNYYRGKTDYEDLRIEKFDIDYESIDEAYDLYKVPEVEGYVLLNWLITERKELQSSN